MSQESHRASCAIHVFFEIKPASVAAFRSAVMQQAHNSLTKEPWCHQFDVWTLPNEPTRFMLFETYDDREAIEKHRSTEHFASFSATVADMIVDKQVSIWDLATPDAA